MMVSFFMAVSPVFHVSNLHRFFVCTKIMQDIIKEYGPAVISVVVIGAMIALVTFLIGSDDSSIVGQAFQSLINSFFTNASTGGA